MYIHLFLDQDLEAERALADANRELITRFEKKIRDTINRVWAE